VERIVALEDGGQFKECIDKHLMKYHDSACSWDQLIEKNAIFVDRHALRIVQPIVPDTSGASNMTHRLDCRSRDASWGRIDFSKGFSQWWYLSHIDFKVPSEHTQEGKRYDGELQMYHFYSVSGEEAGVNNEMGTVSIFLEAYDDGPDYDVLNKLICAWRDHEEKVRSECGLPSITVDYPGCITYMRGDGGAVTTQGNVRSLFHGEEPRTARSAHDLIIENHLNMARDETYEPKTFQLDPERHVVDDSSVDWDAFIAEQYQKEQENHHGRELLNYNHVDWFNYFGMLGVRTEYYYRYSGTQTIPPCHGVFVEGGNRENTNHWRVMKDPLRISKRQLREMHRLLRERIAPTTDPVLACQPDTAAKVDMDTGEVNVARPLQYFSPNRHFTTFCECIDWKSRWLEDQHWCNITNKRERFYNHPYNFATDQF
jgi:carbonic anhydrase